MPDVAAINRATLASPPVRAQRQKRRRRVAGATIVATLPCLLTMFAKPQPLLIWNVSASEPRGLYRVFPGQGGERGDFVVAELPARFRSFAANRQYLPLRVPLVKRIAAAGGDLICSARGSITVNGATTAALRDQDGAGRPLPAWSGCRRLRSDEILLIGDSPWSFDGRYFGISRTDDVIGRAALWWRL